MPDPRDLLLAEDLTDDQVAEILRPLGFEHPGAIDSILQRMAREPGDRMALADSLPGILQAASRSADPAKCLLQLDRVAESYGQRSTLYRALGSDPKRLDTLFAVTGASRALSDVLVLNPEYLDLLADDDNLARPASPDGLRLEASRAASLFQTKEARLNALRRMRRREYLRIGARELTGIGTFSEVVAEISDLACALVAETLAICHEWLDFPLPEKPDRLAVVAFGKLGARELNYSSDIDLAVIWDTPSDEHDGQIARFYHKLTQSILEALRELSPEGRMYRVDMRLRPFGKTGPLGSSVAQFLNYYESWSEPWERQALIKARSIAGPPDLRSKIDAFISDFTFGRPVDASSISQILELKERSEDVRAQSGPMDRQVKHGWGGIRDVEFTVQLLQLVAGYQHQEVRVPSTLAALAALEETEVISPRERDVMEASYIFLRQVEHRLQLAEELPMQTLPEDPEKLQRVAMAMGYRNDPDLTAAEQFMDQYRTSTQAVRAVHERLFKQFWSNSNTPFLDLESLIGSTGADSAILAPYGFRNPDEAARRLRMIARGDQLAPISSQPQRRFLQLMPELLNCIARAPDPDLSLSQLQSIADATGSPLLFFRSLAASPRALDVFTALAGTSEFLAQALSRHPEYIEMMADPAMLAQPRTIGQLETDLTHRVAREKSEEGRLDALRRFRLREFLRIGVRDVAGLAPVNVTNEEISLLAEACIRVAICLAWDSALPEPNAPGALSILGMGKLGGRELHYSSDLDLVCVYEQFGGADEAEGAFKLFEKVTRGLLDVLSRLTAEGRGFRVDLRLRPEGKAGMLALSLEGYSRYFEETIQAWERQALVRARFVAGDRGVGAKLLKRIEQTVWGKPLTKDDIAELRHIKQRIENERSKQSAELIDLKLGPGGILDIEFTAQMLQLAYGAVATRLRKQNTLKALRAIGRAGILPPDDAKALVAAYLFLRRAENRMQIVSELPAEGVPTDEESLTTFARRVGYIAPGPLAAEVFLSDLRRHTLNAERIHERVYFEMDLAREAWKAPQERIVKQV